MNAEKQARKAAALEIRAEAASRKACAGGVRARNNRALHLGRILYRISLNPDNTITYRKQAYPVAGARAEAGDFRSGLVGRKHTANMTITLADGEILSWHQTDTGGTARMTHNEVVRFVTAVNNAARTA